jgi:hypothetical protein
VSYIPSHHTAELPIPPFHWPLLCPCLTTTFAAHASYPTVPCLWLAPLLPLLPTPSPSLPVARASGELIYPTTNGSPPHFPLPPTPTLQLVLSLLPVHRIMCDKPPALHPKFGNDLPSQVAAAQQRSVLVWALDDQTTVMRVANYISA